MKYQIMIERPARKFIEKQPKLQRERLFRAIYQLPNIGDRKAMAGHPGLYRLRVGSYRILYRVEEERLIVLVTDAGNRGDIYKGI